MASDGIRAGRLYWDVDVQNARNAEQRVEALGQKLDRALNRRRSGVQDFDRISRGADAAGSRVDRLAQRFRTLDAQYRAGIVSQAQYTNRLRDLQSGLDRTQRQAGLSQKELQRLADTQVRVNKAQDNLANGGKDLAERYKAIANEVRGLRNTWQATGANTEQTKKRLGELRNEALGLAQNLDKDSKAFGQFAYVARSADATIAGIEGRMSRLGLASQANLAVLNGLRGQLYGLGPAGLAANAALGPLAGALEGASPAALGAAAGIGAVALAAGALARRGIPQVKEFQNAFRVLVASGSDFTEEELDKALRRVAEAAGEAGTQFTRAQLATALSELIKAGTSAREGLDLLVPGMQLAKITGDSLNESTSRLLGNLRQFGFDASYASRAGDQLATADQAAAAGAKELSEGLGTVGPLAKAAGLSFSQTLGILVELDQKGLNPAQEGATGLRAVLAALLDPSAKARDVIQGLGVQLEDADGKARPVIDVMYDLRRAIEGNAEGANLVAGIFGNRAIPAILDLSDASKTLAGNIEDSNGALRDYADTVTDDNLASAQENLQNALDDLSATFTSSFADDIASAAEGLGEFIRHVDTIISNENKWKTAAGLINLLNPFAPRGKVNEFIAGGLPDGYSLGPGGRLIPPAPEPFSGPFTFPGQDFGPQRGTAGPPNPEPARQSLEDLIRKARQLKTALDNARNPQDWIAANRAVAAFRDSSQDASDAWAAVVATTRQETKAATDAGQTVQGVFDDLAKQGKTAEQRSAALGNTLEARVESARTRITLINKAIDDLISLGVSADDARVQYLVQRLQELEQTLADIQTRAQSEQAALEARAKELARRQSLAQQGGGDPTIEKALREQEALTAEQTAQERIAQRRRERFAQSQRADLDAIRAASSEIEKNLKTAADEADRARANAEIAARATQYSFYGDNARAANDRAQAALFEQQRSAREAALESLRQQLRRQGGYSVADALTPENQAAAEAALRTLQSLNDATRRGAQATKEAKQAEAERQKEIARLNQAWERGADIQGQLADATRRGAEASDASGASIEKLQRHLLNARIVFGDTSSEVRELVRQLNELQLKAALDELRDKGVEALSDFARAVLIANGVLTDTNQSTSSLADRMRNLASVTSGTTSDMARGFADVFDGIQAIIDAGSDAEKIIQGVGLALRGATAIGNAAQGDPLDAIRGALSGIGEIAGLAAGIPGVGQLVDAAFGFGEMIVQGISDSLTGDSPAARAIRQNLTPAVADAFTNGILAAVRGQEGWQDDLRDSVKLVFLKSLIDAFVQGALIQTYLQPVIDQYSRIIASGDVQAAKAYLQTALPPAIDAATSAATDFINSLPPGLLPSSGASSGSQPPTNPQAGITNLPTAAVTVLAAPAYVGEMGRHVAAFGSHVGEFGRWVQKLPTGAGTSGGATVATQRGAA